MNTSGHLLAVAPTGSGKTEASVLWALKNLREMKSAKIIYLLPTKNTANSIWKRLSIFFGEDNVGLSHSSAQLFFKDQHDQEEELFAKEEYRNFLFDRTFIRPVTVATVDQLLTTGFNYNHWTVKEINAANAVIIMDEVHSYDPWTLGLITESIRHYSGLGSRFMLMSATMPSHQINHFSSIIPCRVLKDKEMLYKIRSIYEVRNYEIDDEKSLDEINQAVSSGKKVLVVVNTVKKCQDMAVKLSKLSPVCYHSQFILEDRQRIEGQIETADFVIATQVVEVSLDIDFDYLFTECAPPDAVAQRAGRVNRRRNPDRDSRVIIFKHSEKSLNVYDKNFYDPINQQGLLDKSFNTYKHLPVDVTEQTLINIVEEVYKDHDFTEDQIYKKAIKQYGESQNIRMAILDTPSEEQAKKELTRMSTYETINVFPLCFKEQVIAAETIDRQKYEMKVPMWYYVHNKESYKGFKFCDLTYDADLGAILKPGKVEVNGGVSTNSSIII
jgi:CRISPR-associated endonuclease/helicase Cas3